MRAFWPLLIFLPGCTFYSWGNSITPRPASELKDVSPVIYLTLAVFGLILVVSVFTGLFRRPTDHADREVNAFAFLVAFFAALVVLLLVG